ncbi:DNA (cytosine-5-)-methyltransferase [Planctomycetota bacterium]
MKWKSFRIIDLFAGIGGIRIPFEELGGQCVFSSEWDEGAQDTYEANFGERPHGDITKIPVEEIPEHDILLAGFPCQPFSIIGDMKGFTDTRGTLFFNIEAILDAKQPFAFLLENVKQFRTHDNGKTYQTVIEHLEALNYFTHTAVLNALDFGLPQKRERTFIVGFKDDLDFHFPPPSCIPPDLEKILEPDDKIDKSLYASEKIKASRQKKCKIKPFYPSIWHENKAGNVSILPYSCALRAGASYNYLLVNGVRRLSPREMLRLQGYPESFRPIGSVSKVRKQAGNSVPVSVIRAIAVQMIKALRSGKMREPVPAQQVLFT